jgi:chromosomal replication initiator protein
VKLLTLFAGEHPLPVPTEVVEYLADQFPSGPRELRGLLSRVVQAAVRRKCPVNVPLAQTLLGAEPQAQTSHVADIAKEVARQFGVSLRALRSQSRNSESLVPRQAAMYLARDLIGTSYAEIGRYFDDRSHSTVVHACQRFQAVLERDTRLASLVEAIRKGLPAGNPCRKPVTHLRKNRRVAG